MVLGLFWGCFDSQYEAQIDPKSQKTTKNNYTLAAKDPKQRVFRGSLGVYTLGVYSLGPPDLALGMHSLGWESRVWESTLWESTVSGQQILHLWR